jgi:DNA-3-methyladenine glycosylase
MAGATKKTTGAAAGQSHKRERILPQRFYDRDPRIVARDLLGKVLVRTLSHGKSRHRLSGRIVEIEVYLEEGDLAAHSAVGKTARNEVLFGPPGHAYVYFIYGMYYCLNFSCMPEGEAGSVLLRAIEPLEGTELMAEARGISRATLNSKAGMRALTSGPGRLCEALGITRAAFNGASLFKSDSRLNIVDDGWRPEAIVNSARVGITKSADLPLRYAIAGNAFVSGPKG